MKLPEISRSQGGFTLIEMAIVLVIIGLIIASITVSKDTMRTAEYNKVWAKFISPWSQAAYDYFQRTGTVPSCNSATSCVSTMTSVGITLPKTYGVTDEEGTESTMSIDSIVDARTTGKADAVTAARTGGMVVKYTTVPQELAYVVDSIADGDHDATGTKGVGLSVGDVQWASNNLTIRLRDISGSGSGS